jgi:hypothetical protein
MYPESLFYWIGGTAVVLGLLGIIFILAMGIDNWFKKRSDKHEEEDKDG